MMKRILLSTSIDAFLHQGGGEQELKNLHKELNKQGFLCDIYGYTSLDIDNYDIIIHFALGNGINIFLDSFDLEGKILILWPNLWFLNSPPEDYRNFLQSQIDRFNAVVIKSHTEEEQLDRFFHIPKYKKIYASPFVDQILFNFKKSSLFRDIYGLDKYILWNGIIEPQKNQLSIIKLLKNYDIPLILSGSIRNTEYLKACKKEANGTNEIFFIPPMHYMSELHLSAIANCEVYLEIPLDFPGTSSIEAAILNNKICITDCAWSHEYFHANNKFINTKNDDLSIKLDELINQPIEFSNPLKCRPEEFISENALRLLIEYLNGLD